MNYYIQGDAAKAEQIKAAFERLGYYTGVNGWNFNADCGVYFTNESDKTVEFTHIENFVNLIKTHPDYKELELPKPHYDIKNFHAGMPVLVRDSDEHKWLYTIFGIYNKDNSLYPFVVVNMRGYEQCIPFEGNKHLLGTTDPCDEQYINW